MAEYLAVGAFILAATGAGVQAYSANEQGKAQNKAAKAQAQQLEYQAKTAEAQASVDQVRGEQETRKRMMVMAQDIGSMYANFAGNGIDIGSSGVVSSALNTTVNEGIYDADAIYDNARMNIWTHLNEATQLRNQAKLSLFQGRTARHAGKMGTFAQGFSGLGSALAAGGAGYDLGEKMETRGWLGSAAKPRK